MKLKIALVFAIMMAPSISLANGCSYGSQKQAMSCSEGSAYDTATNTCLPVSS